MKRSKANSRISPLRIMVVTLSVVAVACAAEKMTFQSAPAKEAQANYTTRLSKIKDIATTQETHAEIEYVKALTKAEDEAVRHEELDEAIRIRDAIRTLTAKESVQRENLPNAVNGRQLLEDRLAGTQWCENKPGIIWTLHRDGSVTTNDNRIGSWAAIGPREIVLMLPNGFIDKWEFNEALTTNSDTHAHLGSPWKSKRAQ